MPAFAKLALLAALVAVATIHDARAEKKTVCTITVNSADEKETFRRSLPADEYQFVELVEHGRPDWLATACRQGVRCDVLLISGHFDDGTEFYSDRPGVRAALPVDEMERASCSDSCPGLFSQLKEVYLFGCKTLEPHPLRSASAEIGRSLIRSGHSPADADRLSQLLGERHGESNRDHMRLVFKDVPVIYGFSSKAPLGPSAASVLDRYFQSGVGGEVGGGRPSAKLLGLFAPSSMTVARGMSDTDPHAAFRHDVCRLSDDRASAAQKLGFVHALLGREMAEVRMLLDRIEKHVASIGEAERQSPAVARALDAIARDESARGRYLEFAHDADEPAIRARMIELAGQLGWLSPAAKRSELVRMIGDRLAKDAVSPADVGLVCGLNEDHGLDREQERLPAPSGRADKVTHAAVRACLGSTEARAQVIHALTSSDEEEVRIAQVYLHYRPLADMTELRAAAARVARMSESGAQVRALDTLASHHLADPQSLGELARSFARTKSLPVQRAIAGVLIRADFRAIASPDLVQALRRSRQRSPDGADVIDVLIRRMEAVAQSS